MSIAVCVLCYILLYHINEFCQFLNRILDRMVYFAIFTTVKLHIDKRDILFEVSAVGVILLCLMRLPHAEESRLPERLW